MLIRSEHWGHFWHPPYTCTSEITKSRMFGRVYLCMDFIKTKEELAIDQVLVLDWPRQDCRSTVVQGPVRTSDLFPKNFFRTDLLKIKHFSNYLFVNFLSYDDFFYFKFFLEHKYIARKVFQVTCNIKIIHYKNKKIFLKDIRYKQLG